MYVVFAAKSFHFTGIDTNVAIIQLESVTAK